MRKLIMPLLIFTVSSSIFCFASGNLDGAKKFINKFLKQEFIGDQSFRVDNTIYSAERKMWVEKMYSPMIGEIHQWDTDRLCVVDSYKIKEGKVINNKAYIEVEFKEFACTNKQKGYGDKPLIRKEESNIIKYELVYKDRRWWLYDPPKPRISKKAIINFNNEIIERMDEWVFKKGSTDQIKYYNNLIRTNNILKGDNDL